MGQDDITYEYYRKYNNRKVIIDGKKYDSMFEGGHAAELIMLKKAGEIKDFESHVDIPLTAHGKVICHYQVDFKVYHNDGRIEFQETKGRSTPDWRIKWKLFKAQLADEHPGWEANVFYQAKMKSRFWPKYAARKLR